jgi:hypothetical protein
LQQRRCKARIHQDVAVVAGEQNPYRFPEKKRGQFTLRYYPTGYETFAKRGLTRTEQIERAVKAGATHIFFSDADHVWPLRFFEQLCRKLRHDPYIDRCVTSRRKLHTTIEAADALVEEARVHRLIENAYRKALALPMIRKPNRKIAGGAMQFCSMLAVMDKTQGIYVQPKRCMDSHLFRRYQMARSDMQFRRRMGGSAAWELPLPIHLQHRRDKEHGRKKHLLEQR